MTIDDVALTTSLGPGAPEAITTIELLRRLRAARRRVCQTLQLCCRDGSWKRGSSPRRSKQFSEHIRGTEINHSPLPPTPLSPPSPAPHRRHPLQVLNDDPGQNLNLNQPAQGSTLSSSSSSWSAVFSFCAYLFWACYCMCPSSLPGPLARVLLSKRKSSKYADSISTNLEARLTSWLLLKLRLISRLTA